MARVAGSESQQSEMVHMLAKLFGAADRNGDRVLTRQDAELIKDKLDKNPSK